MTNDDPLEARAIARVQNGDAEAYDTLVSNYLRRVVSIAWSITRNAHDAERGSRGSSQTSPST